MATSRQGRPAVQDGTVSPVLRPLLWSALVGAAVAAALASPVYADPPLPNTVPDVGVRPQPVGVGTGFPTTAPSNNFPVTSLVNGPLATQIYTLETEVATLGEQLLKLRQERDDLAAKVTAADAARVKARADVVAAQTAADSAAAHAFKDAAGLPPGAFGSDLHSLDMLGRIQRGEEHNRDTTLAGREVVRARDAERAAESAYQLALTQSRQKTEEFAAAEKKYKGRTAALVTLKRNNVDQLAAIEREREAQEQRLGDLIGTDAIAGMVANPKAIGAVRYALAQRGDPYLWAAEGPNRFDCSGLMWAAYRTQGKTLPRVSRDQYRGTRGMSVAREALLPGDLIFFASGASWTTIHHVGMYIGGGKMVHSPTTGDVVKVSTVWWSRFYAATRVFPAVPAPKPPTPPAPPTTRPPTTTPPQTPRPPVTGAPSTAPTKPPVTPSPPVSPSPPASPSPSASATSKPPADPTPEEPDETPSATPGGGQPSATRSSATPSGSAGSGD
ncbi:C40 family peptidase [Plantactinospora sp. CA-290183]|uniref:C40 family peptidase n=1 Tax=Plantactinospora sp. CA-290183 TaxID=3240006 RepID=UPI003D8C36F0